MMFSPSRGEMMLPEFHEDIEEFLTSSPSTVGLEQGVRGNRDRRCERGDQ